MSAGHHHARTEVPQIDDAFYARVRNLVDDCRRDRDHTIPWLANRSVDGRIVWIDLIVPKILPRCGIDTGETLPYHELGEWLGMNEGLDYDTAHATKGNPCEKRRVEELGGDWDAYQEELAEYIRDVDDEAMTDVPLDIDKRVFVDDHDQAALAAIGDGDKGGGLINSRLKGSADEPRDEHGRWVAGGGTSTQLLSDEGNGLHGIVDKANLAEIAQNLEDARIDLDNQVGETSDAEKAADKASSTHGAGSEEHTDAEHEAADAQGSLAEQAVEVHKHLSNLASKSAAALKAYERELADAGIGSIKADNKGTLTMQRKFVAAQVIADKGLGERQIRVICSDATEDRAKDIMVPSGCQIADYRKNNIVLADHDPTKPIGNAEVEIKADRVESLITFAPAGISPKADEYCGLAKAGVIKAVSIGFDPLEFEPRKAGGFKYLKWDLMEISVLGGVPCNPNATVIARSVPAAPRPAKAAAAKGAASEWKVGASRNLPIDADSAWDGEAAKASIFKQAGFDGDSPDTAYARKGFLVYDAAAPKLKGSYKLPFAQVKDGRLTALASGIRAAASRLPQTDIPDDAQTKARAVIDHYEAKMGDKAGRATKLKGLYDVACLCELVCRLGYLHDSACFEQECEGDNSKLPAMLAASLQSLCSDLLAMTAEEVGELLAGRVEPLADDVAYVEAAATPRNKNLRAALRKARKAGRVLSQENLDRLTAIQKCMGKAMDCYTKAADLHDDVHGIMEEWMNHGTSAGEHVKEMLKAAGHTGTDAAGNSTDDGDGSDDAGDHELSADIAARKRLVEVMERSAV